MIRLPESFIFFEHAQTRFGINSTTYFRKLGITHVRVFLDTVNKNLIFKGNKSGEGFKLKYRSTRTRGEAMLKESSIINCELRWLSPNRQIRVRDFYGESVITMKIDFFKKIEPKSKTTFEMDGGMMEIERFTELRREPMKAYIERKTDEYNRAKEAQNM